MCTHTHTKKRFHWNFIGHWVQSVPARRTANKNNHRTRLRNAQRNQDMSHTQNEARYVRKVYKCALICCLILCSVLTLFPQFLLVSIVVRMFVCFFFIKKAIIYRTSVLSSLICKKILERNQSTSRKKRKEKKRAIRAWKTIRRIVCFSWFVIRFVFGSLSFWWDVAEMWSDDDELHGIRIVQCWILESRSRMRFASSLDVAILKRVRCVLLVISILVAACFCYDPECWSINSQVNWRGNTGNDWLGNEGANRKEFRRKPEKMNKAITHTGEHT